MLSIGEFSSICKVSAKTLRYYAEIGLLMPEVINPESGYRYYSIKQLETMLFINRLKSYNFSLEEIKIILESEELQEEKLYSAFIKKKKELEKQLLDTKNTLIQLSDDISVLEQGKSIMSYLDSIDIQLAEVSMMHILSVRKMVRESEFVDAYKDCFGKLFRGIADKQLTMTSPPMVLFHGSEYTASGLDTEFAVPVKEFVTGTRDFTPGLCLKTVVYGSYSQLPSVYTKQYEWAKKEGYECTNAVFEVYITDPSEVENEDYYITEVYYPVKKKSFVYNNSCQK